jgi:fructokinase
MTSSGTNSVDIRIGIDLGGTKTEAIALDRSGAVLARPRVASPRNDYEATIECIAGLVAKIETDLGQRGSVGVGMPGAISPATGLVKNANSTWLNGRAFEADLSERLQRPVRTANDANCLAVSEATDGAAAGQRIVFAAILGTGVGGGIAIEGKVQTGRNAVAGEWGHTPLPWMQATEFPGPECYCGRRGCIERFLSGPAAADHFRLATGRDLTMQAIAEAAEAGDPAAEHYLSLYEHRLARALSTIIDVIDPDAIVLGGGVSNITRLYRTVPPLLGEYCFSDRIDTAILPARHGDSSGVRGAAWLWP